VQTLAKDNLLYAEDKTNNSIILIAQKKENLEV
jgi:hypothetical protein